VLAEDRIAQLEAQLGALKVQTQKSHHRVRNQLQSLVGLLRAGAAPGRSPDELIDTAVWRVLAFAAVYGLLARADDESVELGALIEQLVASQRVGASLDIDLRTDARVQTPIMLTPEEALPLAVAIAELLCTAVQTMAAQTGPPVSVQLLRVGESLQLDIVSPRSTQAPPPSDLPWLKELLAAARVDLELLQQEDRLTARLRLNAPAREAPVRARDATRVLVVDDDAVSLRLLARTLESESMTVLPAEHAEGAWAVLERDIPDLVVTDVSLPGVNGLDLARRLRDDQRLRGVPIIALSGYTEEYSEREALEAGCDAYVRKPVDTRRLAQLLRGFLEGKP
jgi:CheY-like chemotaxis protein